MSNSATLTCRCTGRSRSFVVVVNNAWPATDCARGVPITRMIFDHGDAQYRVLAMVVMLVLVACVCWCCECAVDAAASAVCGQTAKNITGCVRRRGGCFSGGGVGGGVRRRMPPRARARVSAPAIARSRSLDAADAALVSRRRVFGDDELRRRRTR